MNQPCIVCIVIGIVQKISWNPFEGVFLFFGHVLSINLHDTTNFYNRRKVWKSEGVGDS